MENPFTKHCRSVGETYTQHLAFAVRCGMKMGLGGLACMIHGVFPFCFTTTGSRTVFALYERFTAGARRKVTQTQAAPSRAGSVRCVWRDELGAGI